MNRPHVMSRLRCETCAVRADRVFCGFTSEAKEKLAALGVHIALSSGAVLHRQGEDAESVGIVCEGQVKVSCSSKTGKSLILRIAGPGEIVGLSAAIIGKPHETTAETIAPIQLKVIPRAALLDFMKEFPEVGCRTAATLAAEYESTFHDAKRLALCTSAESRLGSVLLEWARAVSVGEELMFHMALSHAELGEMAGLSRETVTRTLASLRKRKLIDVKGATIRIPSPTRLEDLCD
jgi:CRP/FNR family cyclic AMP-dependent transcriptional regulator